MKTPQQLQKKEQRQEGKEREEYVRKLESQLERAIGASEIGSKGGEFALGSFQKDDLAIVKEYCQKYGWDVWYVPRTEGGYSMTTRSEYEYTVHSFTIKPRK